MSQNSPDNGSKQPASASNSDVYYDMRGNIIGLNPSNAGLSPTPEMPSVWGVLMEVSRGFSMTLVSLADGTTSLYNGQGGGMLGMGEHPAIADATRKFVAVAEQYRSLMNPATEFPIPEPLHVRFYVLTYDDGAFTADFEQHAVENPQHPFYQFCAAGQNVITQLSLHSPAPR